MEPLTLAQLTPCSHQHTLNEWLCFMLQFNGYFVAFITCSSPPRRFTAQQSIRPDHRTSGSQHSHNAPVFRSALPTSLLPYSCRSPGFTSYCVPQKEGEPMHDLVVHYNQWKLPCSGWTNTGAPWVCETSCLTEQGMNALWEMCYWSHQCEWVLTDSRSTWEESR